MAACTGYFWMMQKRMIPSAVIALAVVSATSATAGEAKPAGNLPGVGGSYAIVKPAPAAPAAQPEQSEGADGRGTTFQAGNFQVTVTGSISVEIGFGKRTPGGRR